MVFREGIGWVYEQDKNAVKDAEEKLTDLRHQESIDKFDEAIDALEDLKKEINVYDENGILLGTKFDWSANGMDVDALISGIKELVSVDSPVADMLNAATRVQNLYNTVANNNQSVTVAIGDIYTNPKQ